ncbi:MAG: cytochrome P450 [Chloroflexota bacterium]|nr:cytochrome P450 [Chloroflexota bacterium]
MVTDAAAETTKPIPYIQERRFLGSQLFYNRDRLRLYSRIAAECGPVGGFHFGPFPIILFNAPEYVQAILIEHANDFEKGRLLRNTFRPVVGNGIFTSEGEFHRQQRKLMAPSFQPRQVASYAECMVDYGERIQQGWCDGAVIDINRQMTAITLSIIGKTLFDADVFNETDELVKALTTIIRYIAHQLSAFIILPLDWPTPRNLRTQQAIQVIRTRIQRMIAERRNTGDDERNDFLSLLLKARDEEGKQMDDEQVRDESVTLFRAGHETTAAALTWAWYLLATHPAIYQRMQQEIDAVLQGRRPTYADLASLPYSLQVFKEAMRLYPPVAAFSRVAMRDVTVGEYLVRKGETVFLVPYTLHRTPAYFPQPEQFDPERFTPEQEQRLPRNAYIPFGEGARICIGKHFALLEGHLLLVTLAQRVSFELLPGQKIRPDLRKTTALRPAGSIKMIVRRRDTAQ